MAATSEIQVPDIGDFKDVPIIEIHVNPGDAVKTDDPLITLESDKATMDVPAPRDGTVDQLLVKVGDKVSEGTAIVRLKGDGAAAGGGAGDPAALGHRPAGARAAAAPAAGTPARPSRPSRRRRAGPRAPASPACTRARRSAGWRASSASTSPRSGARARRAASPRRTCGASSKARRRPPPRRRPPRAAWASPRIPAVDFSKFGPVETRPLARIKRISGPFLHRAWLNVPHVTHGDEADITEIEEYRKQLDSDAKADKKKPYRVSLLPFLMKASVSALKMFPEFNSSLAPEKDALVYKKYYNIGIAVDTPEGLVVPVFKDVDRKGIVELSRELGDTSAKARDGKLAPADMQGGTFTISSLGGIGGTDFTPIVNAPEVAILGVVRSKTAPVWDGEAFKPRLMLPLYVSYDHRVIDGALAARFTRHLCTVLEDVRRLVL